MSTAANELALEDGARQPRPRAPIVTHDRLWHGIGILLGSAVCFGVMAVCVRVAARELDALHIAFVRFLGSLLLLVGIVRGRRLRPKPGNLSRVLVRGLLGCAAIVCYFVAIRDVGAGLATILQCTYPIPTAIIATLVFGEAASPWLPLAIAVDLIGIVLVVGPSVTLATVSPTGIAFGLAGAVLAGGAVATAQHLRASEEASLITIYFMAVGALVTAPALLNVGAMAGMSSQGVAALVGVVVTSAAGQWLLHHGLGYTPASVGSLVSATSVMTAAGLEAVLLGEHLPGSSLAGALLMSSAVGLAARRRRA
ncbi:MAG: DMT family transporter [Candidatus Binatia bacterium]